MPGPVHPSVTRLLECARKATVNAPKSRRVDEVGDLPKRLGISSARLTNWKNRGVSKEGALLAGRVFKCQPDWILDGTTHVVRESAPNWTNVNPSSEPAKPRGEVAQHVSDPVGTRSPLVQWGEIMEGDIDARFRVAVPDDAMAPRVRAGQIVEMAAGEEPRPGDGVLVRDASGAHYLRAYRKGRPGHWEAYPLNDAYQTLESARDGLKVVAVLVAVEGRWG